jgi:organic hydroperoxide reductase OsmC/OhrA
MHSEYRVSTRWKRATAGFTYEEYNREHTWSFDGGIQVRASAAPAFRGRPDAVDPEEAFVAALSSCHLLTFLALAAKKRLVVDAYDDDAVGFMEKNGNGKLAMTRVILRPRVRFGGSGAPSTNELMTLHEHAHRECFIANSVLTAVTVEPALADA